MRIKASLEDFQKWLEERGYEKMMGREGFLAFLNLGFPALLFNNSSLLYAFIFTKLGFPRERAPEKLKFEIAKRIKAIFAERDYLEIEFE